MPSPERSPARPRAPLRRTRRARRVDLHLAGGEFALVTGRNGAGKTTLLRVLATVIRPSAGAVAVAGHALPRAAPNARPLIGYVGHAPLTYPGLTARENLELYAALYGVPADRIGSALERVGSARVLGLFATSLVLGAVWAWWELRTVDPLVDIRLMRSRPVVDDERRRAGHQAGNLGSFILIRNWCRRRRPWPATASRRPSSPRSRRPPRPAASARVAGSGWNDPNIAKPMAFRSSSTPAASAST